MEKIASKLNYLKGLLKGVEINGGKKNIIMEEIVEILDLMSKEMMERRREDALPLSVNKAVDERYNDKTMRRSDFTPSMDSGDIWYDESLGAAKYPEASVYRPRNQKILLEKLCKHCGTFVRAEFGAEEYERVRIQCPKCKHFILPDEKAFSWDDKSVNEVDSFENEYSFKDLVEEASRELSPRKTDDEINFSIAQVEDEILFSDLDIGRDFNTSYANLASGKKNLDDLFDGNNFDRSSAFNRSRRPVNVLEEEGYLKRFN